ncbi:hypothetical protein NOG11_01525 [Parvularcula sp. BGMRC 0090]|uniref:Uncharacterized protein n=2 Tax=Parvularcula maris TaxID=2965077 RepID=A0A9X2L8D8_9PROT|nr:hypothetical protein [Parvularcula maris]
MSEPPAYPSKKVDALESHRSAVNRHAAQTSFVVFVCGPAVNPENSASIVREKIKKDLEEHGFDVVYGEDDGLEESRVHVGMNAQDNELKFIANECRAVVIVASSVGSFAELGLFSWHFAQKNGIIDSHKCDLICLIDKKYNERSYLTEGPAQAVDGHGRLLFVDFDDFDTEHLVKRLSSRRATALWDTE